MLSELSIRNLGLIGSSSIELSPKLTVISGETGAGKSMLLSAIHLLTGGRASGSSVGKLSEQLSVDSSWSLDPEDHEKLLETLEELGAEAEHYELHLSRTVKSDGKSKAIVGGRPTTAKVLGSVTEELISLHGQSDQLRLRDSAEQLRILDGSIFWNEDNTLTQIGYTEAYRIWRKAAQALKEVKANAASKRREIATLNSFIEDYEAIDPQPGEIDLLQGTISRLENLEQIRTRLLAAQGAIDSEDYSPLSLLETAAEELRRAKSLDPELDALHATVEEICEQIAELTKGLERELDRSDEDALEELAEAQGRIVEVQALLKRSGVDTVEELDEEITAARKSLAELSVYGRPLEELEAELKVASERVAYTGTALTKLRKAEAKGISEKVNRELKGLAMGSTTFSVEFKPSEPTLSGVDEVSFTIQQRGQDPQPMAKAASGGELSRLMLALELSVADPSTAKTYIFDEVDAGIGGKTAGEVGRRLARLSEAHQVIVVSHLAQVAAFADVNLKVSKEDDGSTVSTTVSRISDTERPREIARMLSGHDSSESALEHARELLDSANRKKN